MVKIYKQPFAHDGDTIAIPDVSQPDGKMSSADGWTPDYQLPKTDPNYKPVGRQEMNGVFKEVTEALGQVQVQGSAAWSADGAPYPINAQVYHNSKQWLALRANSVEPTEGEDWTELVGKYHWPLVKRFLTANLTMYLDAENGDDNNDGESYENPKKSLKATLDSLRYIDSGGYSVQILISAGVYEAQHIDLTNTPAGLSLISTAAKEEVIFDGRTICHQPGTIYFENILFRFNPSEKPNEWTAAFESYSGANTFIENCSIRANQENVLALSAKFASISVRGSCYIKPLGDGADVALSATNSGAIGLSHAVLTVDGLYHYCVVGASSGGSIDFFRSEVVGGSGLQGVRYRANLNGIIDTRGGGANFIPGTEPGVLVNGGQYA